MLLASFWVLMLECIPHHHNQDGFPCMEWGEGVQAEGHRHAPGCEAQTRNHPPLPNILIEKKQVGEQPVDKFIPLYTFLQILYPEAFPVLPAGKEDFIPYIEPLHGIWIVQATGLRAPPRA